MTVSAAAAANVLLAEGENRGIALDPMKLQKLLYLAQGYYSALTEGPWISEPFEAWDYGPVVPSLYREFRNFGAKAIKSGRRLNRVHFLGKGKGWPELSQPAGPHQPQPIERCFLLGAPHLLQPVPTSGQRP